MSKIFILLLSISLFLASCSSNVSLDNTPTISTNESVNTDTEFIDKIIFLGESTTYHLKSRGVLKNGTKTLQVWGPKSGTLMLDTTTCECRIVYPDTGEELELSQALKRKKPEYMMLTFGLNGASTFISRGKEYLKFCYQKLTDTIRTFSPQTEIYINSCFPVAKNMNMSNYTIDSKTLNEYINTINSWAYEFAIKNGFVYIDTASLLKNDSGYLSEKYQAEDGYHLNVEAYKTILERIKTIKSKGNGYDY